MIHLRMPGASKETEPFMSSYFPRNDMEAFGFEL